MSKSLTKWRTTEQGDKEAVPLTDKAVAALKPQAAAYRVTDGGCGGLFLIVRPSGLKVWRCVYGRDGQRHQMKLGEYPAMSLAEARIARLDARLKVRDGHHPVHERDTMRRQRIERDNLIFEVMARRRHAFMAAQRWSPNYAKCFLQRLEAHAFPVIGRKPIALISRSNIIDLLEQCVAKSGAWQADHVRQHLVLVFDDLVERELITANPAASLTRKFPTPHKQPQPAILEVDEVRGVLAAVEGCDASMSMKLMHRFLALTGLRPSEVREAQWRELAVSGEWRIPGERMKGRRGRKRPHTVFLSPQAQEVIEVARALAPAGAVYVFPTDRYGQHRHQPIARSSLCETMTRVLGRRVHVAHGWRASMSTILNGMHPADRHIIDAMLAHATKDTVEARYNRTTELTYRKRARELWRDWAATLLEGAPSAWKLAGLPGPVAAKAPAVVALDGARVA